MSREEYIRASVAIAATRLFPTTVRDAVISDVKFTEGFGLKANAIIRFGRDDLTFQRSAFFNSIRQAFHPGHEPVPVDNTQGETWEICILADKSPIQDHPCAGNDAALGQPLWRPKPQQGYTPRHSLP